MLVCIDERNYEFRRYLNAVGIYNELLTVMLFYCYKIEGFCFLLVCFTFVFCHVFKFVRYIGVYYTFGLLDCFYKDFVISRFFPIHFTVTLVGLKTIVRYIEEFVISKFVKSRFHDALSCNRPRRLEQFWFVVLLARTKFN